MALPKSISLGSSSSPPLPSSILELTGFNKVVSQEGINTTSLLLLVNVPLPVLQAMPALSSREVRSSLYLVLRQIYPNPFHQSEHVFNVVQEFQPVLELQPYHGTTQVSFTNFASTDFVSFILPVELQGEFNTTFPPAHV